MFRLQIAALFIAALATSVHARAQENIRTRDVVYGRKHGMALTMDVWKPAKQNGAGVVFMVSGAFKSGVEMIDSGFYGPVMFKPFLDRGYTIYLVSHGAQPKFTVDEIVADIHRAVRFIRHHAKEDNVDPNRLAIMGTSSGGYLSLMIGATGTAGEASAADPVDRESSRVQAVGCFCPPSDLVNYGEPGRSIVEYEPVNYVWHAFGVEGKRKDEQVAALRALSPLTFVTDDMPPTLIVHGTADPKVPYEQSVRLVAKLAEINVPHKLIAREGAAHGWRTMGNDHSIVADWFDTYLQAVD